jgi:hypothetical protein
MILRAAALFVALSCTATAALAADNNSFTLLHAGKPIGRASYTIDTTKDGYRLRAHFEYRTPAVSTDTLNSGHGSTPTEAQYSSEFKIDLNGNFLSGYTQNAANQMITSYQPSKLRDSITVSQNQGGISGDGRTLAMPSPDFLVAPDYDPGTLQILLTTSLAHPHKDSRYSLLVPGSGIGPKSSNTLIYIAIHPASDATGTLDGKPVTLKHYQLSYLKGAADLYTDDAGHLMEADMGPLGSTYVRAKFALLIQ